MQIDIEGDRGCDATIMCQVGSPWIIVSVLTLELTTPHEYRIPADADNDKILMEAQILNLEMEGVRGTNSDIDAYYHLLKSFTNAPKESTP